MYVRLVLIFFFFLGGTKCWTQRLTHVRQILYTIEVYHQFPFIKREDWGFCYHLLISKSMYNDCKTEWGIWALSPVALLFLLGNQLSSTTCNLVPKRQWGCSKHGLLPAHPLSKRALDPLPLVIIWLHILREDQAHWTKLFQYNWLLYRIPTTLLVFRQVLISFQLALNL